MVGIPDPHWGETPQAFVVVRPGASVSAEELIQFVRDQLAHFKAPRGVSFLAELCVAMLSNAPHSAVTFESIAFSRTMDVRL